MAEFAWWPWQPLRPPVPDRPLQRSCGCLADPVVFGHFHPYGCEGMAVQR